jgi:hypothetical protein
MAHGWEVRFDTASPVNARLWGGGGWEQRMRGMERIRSVKFCESVFIWGRLSTSAGSVQACGGVDGQRTLSRNHGRERVTARGWTSVSTRLRQLTQGFGEGETVRMAGWWSTDFVAESRTGTDDGARRVEVRFGEGEACGGVWWSTDFVTESWAGTDDGARVGKSVSTRLRPSLRSQRKALGEGKERVKDEG